MKHIKNLTTFFFMFILQIVLTITGWFVVPIGMLFMETFQPLNLTSRYKWQKRFKWKWFDSIFGNKEDGIADIYYTKKYAPFPKDYKPTFWRTYNWLAFRNPIHNLALKMGVQDVIVGYIWQGRVDTEDRIGHEGFVYSEAIGKSGKRYPMYRWCKLWFKDIGIEMNIGYKNFNVHKEELPKFYRYSFTISINPFKRFER